MVVTPSFTDSGAGLDRAELSIGGRVTPPVYFNATDKCRELSPADGTNDRPIDVTACRNGEFAGENLPLKALTAPIVAWEDKQVKDRRASWCGSMTPCVCPRVCSRGRSPCTTSPATRRG